MTYHNILIVKLSAIGDVVQTLPVAYYLKTCFPQASISWVVERPAYEILTNNPYIDEIILFDKPRFKSLQGLWHNLPPLVKLLRERNFDLALDLQGLFKSAAIARLSGAPTRLVYETAKELSWLLCRRVVGPHCHGHVVQRYLDVVRELGCPVGEAVFPVQITATEILQAEQVMAEAGLVSVKPYVILAPGTTWQTKYWPSGHFSVLADKLSEHGITPVLIGSPGEVGLAGKVLANALHPVVNLTGKTTLKHLTHIIRGARAFVGADTGTMHLAAAMGTPVVAMYGPSNPGRNGPYGEGHVVIQAPVHCVGCKRHQCARNCMAMISPERTYAAVLQLLSRSETGDTEGKG